VQPHQRQAKALEPPSPVLMYLRNVLPTKEAAL
jgi:hypothetical protein